MFPGCCVCPQASRDNKSLMIVRYSDLKKSLSGAFTDLAVAAAAARGAAKARSPFYPIGLVLAMFAAVVRTLMSVACCDRQGGDGGGGSQYGFGS
jgi:uncharacterized protein (DUF2062 family)